MNTLNNGFSTLRTSDGVDVYDNAGKLFAKEVYDTKEYDVLGYWAILYEPCCNQVQHSFGSKINRPIGMLYFYKEKIGEFIEISVHRQFGYIDLVQPISGAFGLTRFLYDKNGKVLAGRKFEVYANGFIGKILDLDNAIKVNVVDRANRPFLETNCYPRFSKEGYYILQSLRYELYSPKKVLLKTHEKIEFTPEGFIRLSEKCEHNLTKVEIYDPFFHFVKETVE